MIRIRRLPARRWREYKKLRLEALMTDPIAFGSSYDEEVSFSEGQWSERMSNVLFALSDGRPVGTLSCVFNDRAKTKHVAHIYGVYVTPKYRGRGIGGMLLRRTLSDVQKKREVIKVQLSVNPALRPAVILYKRVGFEEVGRAKKELRVGGRYYDMLMMEKEIRKVKG